MPRILHDPSSGPPHLWLAGDPYGTEVTDPGERLAVMALGACSCVPAPGLEIERRRLQILGGTWLGTCGDANHRYGFHCAACMLPSTDYSMAGAVNQPVSYSYGCAIDCGMGWPASRSWLRWLIGEIAANRIVGVAEVIGSYDGRSVRYWSDQTGWHTDGVPYTGTGHDVWTHIGIYRSTAEQDHGLLAGWTPTGYTPQEDDMTPDQDLRARATDARLRAFLDGATAYAPDDLDPTRRGKPFGPIVMLKQLADLVATLRAEQAAADARDTARDQLTLAAIQGMATAGGPEVAPILARIDARAGELRDLAVQQYGQEMAAIRANHADELAGLRAQLDALTRE